MINWQRDPKWINTTLGTSGTIGQYGCTISVIGNIIGVDPTVVNERMKAVGGFANGNLVIWAKIEEAFPGIKIRRVWSYDNTDVLANVPNVIVEVPAAPIGGTGSHWVQFLGNKQLADPWTGKIRPTSDFPNPTGYCVISGRWQGLDDASAGTLLVDKRVFEHLVKNSTERDEIANMGFPSVQSLRDKLAKDDEVAKNLNSTISDKNRRIAELEGLLSSANSTVTNQNAELETLRNQSNQNNDKDKILQQAEDDKKALRAEIDTLTRQVGQLKNTSYLTAPVKKIFTALLKRGFGG